MSSFWRKLTKKQDEKPVFPMGVAPVDQSMQAKYAKGVQYNMKLIIKGDRNTGKSMLLQRLTGSKFKEDYIPTQEIQVSNVNWNYQGAGDVVKVEVWDIVDKSRKKRTTSGSLKIANDDEDDSKENDNDPLSSLALDAQFIDVYKGTHGVFLVMDITKAWTWKYVQRELEKIPRHIPVLLLANYRDIGDHRVIQTDEIIAYIEHLDRPTGSAEIYFTETSMKDGFGLRFIYRFLNMPFLMLQRETLLRQLEANTLEIEDTRESLSIDPSSEEQDYERFKEMLERKNNPSLYPKPKEDILVPNDDTSMKKEEPPAAEVIIPDTTQQQASVVTPVVETIESKPAPKQLPVATVSPTIHTNESPKTSRFQAYKAKLFGSSNNETPKEELKIDPQPAHTNEVVPIDEFHPGQLDDDFLSGDTKPQKHQPARKLKAADSDDDSDDGNPMVAAYEDLESDDDIEILKNETFVDDDNDDDDVDDFDDLSDDERPEIESVHELSIMEKVKANKKLQKQEKVEANHASNVEVMVVNTEELNLDKPDYVTLDSDNDMDSICSNKDNIIPSTQIDTTTINKTNSTKTNSNKIITKVSVSSDLDDLDDVDSGNRDNPYVIAADVDVDDDWINDKDSEDDDVEDTTEVDVDVDDTNSTNNPQQDSSVNFSLDGLEAFMSDQLSKTTPVVVEETMVKSTEAEKPKKKKKKKTTTTSTTETAEASTPTTEKRKKKKTKTKESNGGGDDTEKTPTTKTKKSKKVETSENTSKPKKTKKKSVHEETLDSFFAS